MKTSMILRILTPVVVILLVFSNRHVDTYLFGEARSGKNILPAGSIEIPTKRTIGWSSRSDLADSLFRLWNNKPLGDWSFDEKMDLPRNLLAHLLANQNIPVVNERIMNLRAWGKPGSKWIFNPKGGYDFSATTLTTILYLFDDKPQLLYPETKKHLVEVLLTDEGKGFSEAVPGTLGRINDSENHVLMAQGSKYLKNRYRMLHGNQEARFNNEQNGMEKGILAKLNELSTIGLYEFNSVPYLGYTLAALLNLEAFGSEKVQNAARGVLDYLSFGYALGSYRFSYYPPFRRRLERAKVTSLSKDYQTVFMKTWLSFFPEIKQSEQIESGESHALIAACMPYRPADEVVNLIFSKSPGYFMKLGHGTISSPEIYSAGPNYLISAGGVNRGKRSNIVARPVCLFLDDNSTEINDVFHINGKGKNIMKWNNTGVYKDFACSNGPVSVPEKFKPAGGNKFWKVYAINDSLSVAVHTSEELGIISVFKNRKPDELAGELLKSNPDPEILKTNFQFPSGSKIGYDVNSPENKWVIKSADGKLFDRNFDQWPLISGDFMK